MYNSPPARQFFRSTLWGYPDLFQKLYGEVRSSLAEESEKGRAREKEEQRGMAVEHVNNEPVVMEENNDNTTSAPTQFSPLSPSNDGYGPLVMAQRNAQPDIQILPINHHPASDEHYLSTVIIETTEVLELTSGSQIPQPDIGSSARSTNEIEEVPGPSTLHSNNEELRVSQSKEEMGK